jgi:uncharacterized membrane protein
MSNSSSFLQKKEAWIHFWLLVFWLVVGTALRFTNLESKPPWADEWATLVFSLGHSFLTIPLDRLISLDTLLLPLQIDSTAQAGDAIANLMKESTHPPVYFVLTHLWLKLFGNGEGLVSVWLARSLSALLGVVSIPAMFGLGWLFCRSQHLSTGDTAKNSALPFVVGQIAAGLMAVSPYGIYLAQEARHYTLVILWIIASLACLIISLNHLQHQRKPPYWIILVWILVNSLGVATHYFVGLSLVAETIVLLSFWLKNIRSVGNNRFLDFKVLFSPRWQRIAIAIIGSVIGCSVWIFTWRDIPDSNLTEWIHHGNPWGSEFFEPLGRLCAWIVSMLFLLPIEGTSVIVTVISAVLMMVTLLWLIVTLISSFKNQKQLSTNPLFSKIIITFILTAIVIVLFFTYALDTDLTQAARFQFFYFPAIILEIAPVFANIWHKVPPQQFSFFPQKTIVIVILIMGFLGGLTVINNFAYQKPDRPDLVVPTIIKTQQLTNAETPVIIATVHKNHEQTGEMIGLAWEWQRQNKVTLMSPQFLLLHKKEDATVVTHNLHEILTQLPRPFALWLVNFSAPEAVEKQNCYANTDFKHKVPGYSYRLYLCTDN